MSEVIEATGWTLIHFLWQATAVAVLLAGTLQFFKSAWKRYVASGIALLAMVVFAIGTFLKMADFSVSQASAEVAEMEQAIVAVEYATPISESELDIVLPTTPTVDPEFVPFEQVAEQVATPRWHRWVVSLWLVGVSVFALRFFFDWRSISKLRKSSRELKPNSAWHDRFLVLSERIGIYRPAKIFTSVSLQVPVVLGVIRPVVIVPAAMLSGLSPAQADAILLHELAHVRRHDFLVNLLQTFLETLFFFHPAVWWISNQMRKEREHCCDDLATATCGDVSEYACALAALETSRADYSPGLAADGGKNSDLLGRIRRLVKGDEFSARSRLGWPLIALSGVVITGAVFALMSLNSAVSAADDESTKTDWEDIKVTQFGNKERQILAIHTTDSIAALVVIQPPKEWTSHSFDMGVKRIGKGDSDWLAWADPTWNDVKIKIRFNANRPQTLLLNDQSIRLDWGKVVFWREAEKWADQSSVIDPDLPELRENADAKLKAVRELIIDQLAAEDAGNKLIAPTKPGKWELGNGVTFELTQSVVHGADVKTDGIIRWPESNKWPALRFDFNIAADAFANREKWRLALEKDVRKIWIVSGDYQECTLINFENPEQIIIDGLNSAFGNMPDSVRAHLQKEFRIDKKLDKTGIPHLGGNAGGQRIVTAKVDEEFVVKGKIYDDENGGPFAGVYVRASTDWAPMNVIAGTRTDDNGDFELRFRIGLDTLTQNFRGLDVKPMMAGYYDRDLNGRGEFHMSLGKFAPPGKREPERGNRSLLILGKPMTTEFRMKPGARISGVVVDENDKPVSSPYVGVQVDEAEDTRPWTGPMLQRPGVFAGSGGGDVDGKFVLTGVPTDRDLHLVAAKYSAGMEGKTETFSFSAEKEYKLKLVLKDGALECGLLEDKPTSEKSTLVRIVDKQVEIEGSSTPLTLAESILNLAKASTENLSQKGDTGNRWQRALSWGHSVHVVFGGDFKKEDLTIDLIGKESPAAEMIMHLGGGKPGRVFIKTEDGKTHLVSKFPASALGRVIADPALGLREKSWAKPLVQSVTPTAFAKEEVTHFTINGTVVDDETGKVIKQGVGIQGGMSDPKKPGGPISWGYSSRSGGNRKTGKFTYEMNHWKDGYRCRVIVDGYEPKPILTEFPGPNVTAVDVTVRLKKLPGISGRILDFEGKPVENVAVFSVPPTGLNLYQGKAWGHGDSENTSAIPVKTDAEGNFKNLPLGESRQIAISSTEFDVWVQVVGEGKNEVEIRLPEPATFVMEFDIPGAGDKEEVFFQYLQPFNADRRTTWKSIRYERGVEIPKGKTVLKSLPPGSYQIMRRGMADMGQVSYGTTMEREFFTVKPGESRSFDWTREEGGARIKGKVDWNRKTELTGVMFRFTSVVPNKDLGGLDEPNVLDAGTADLETGEFHSAMIPPGKYTLSISAQKPIPEARMRMSGLIMPDYRHEEIEVTVEKGGPTEIVLEEIWLGVDGNYERPKK